MPILKTILKRHFWFILVLVILLPAIGVFFILIAPVEKKEESLREQLKQLEKAKENKIGQLKTLDESNQLLANLSLTDIEKLKELLPNQKDIEGLLQVLEDKAQENGFILKNVEISEAKQEKLTIPGVKTLKITANFIGGNYESFKNLLSALERNARLLEIISINFAPGTGNYSLNMESYWLEKSPSLSLQIKANFFDEPLFKILKSGRRELKVEPSEERK
jgi:Tfp pilus assembly protein PilO